MNPTQNLRRPWRTGLIILILGMVGFSRAACADLISLETPAGEPLLIHQTLPSPGSAESQHKPLIVWLTEGYRTRAPFEQLVQQLNEVGHEVWVVDLLESYFLERTPSNVRQLSGEGVRALLGKAQQQGRPFVLVASGRMSLVSLRGLRLWQLQDHPPGGRGNLLTSVQFFPNLLDAPKKAGDLAPVFPDVMAASVPLIWIQPELGSQRVHVSRLVQALTQRKNQLWMVHLEAVRDGYFLRRDATEREDQARLALPHQMAQWLALTHKAPHPQYHPAVELDGYTPNVPLSGLVELEPRPAPELSLRDAQGQSISLASKAGKVVLVNFWASWCPPCVKEIPSMNRLAQTFDAKDFEIVSVNFKESAQTVHDFMREVQVDFPVLMDQEGLASGKWNVFAFPSSFLVNQQGQLIASVNSAIEWDEPHILERIQKAINWGQ